MSTVHQAGNLEHSTETDSLQRPAKNSGRRTQKTWGKRGITVASHKFKPFEIFWGACRLVDSFERRLKENLRCLWVSMGSGTLL